MPRSGASDAVLFLPLGGSDEIGMNLYLYGLDGKWIAVDCGISFGDESTPGIDVLLPDITYIAERADDLEGIVLTHAHEDHLGAIPYLWQRLGCPIYATPFTAAFLRLKLTEVPWGREVEIVEIDLGGRFRVGPFDLEYVSVAHSIPEPNALVLRSRVGTIVHTGDWKLDPTPVMGAPTDEATFRALGDEGVLALVGDSTGAMVQEHSGSEAQVLEGLTELIARQTRRVAVTCFASNVGRVHSIARAAHRAGRHVALVGRSLWRIHQAALETGHLDLPEEPLTEDQVGFIPEDKIVLICTGSQGEPRSALVRIARDEHPNVTLSEGDTVIFSSREIPGNEKAISRVQNLLVGRGIRVVTAEEEPVHVSGHPSRPEIETMYQWLRPRISIPVHGEPMHQAAHAEIARSCQVPHVQVPTDGMVIALSAAGPRVVDQVQSGTLALEGDRLLRLDGNALRSRSRMKAAGAVVATLVLDARGDLAADPAVSMIGLEDQEGQERAVSALALELRVAVEDMPRPRRRDDSQVREVVYRQVRRTVRDWTGKKPLTEVHVVRL